MLPGISIHYASEDELGRIWWAKTGVADTRAQRLGVKDAQGSIGIADVDYQKHESKLPNQKGELFAIFHSSSDISYLLLGSRPRSVRAISWILLHLEERTIHEATRNGRRMTIHDRRMVLTVSKMLAAPSHRPRERS